VITASQVRKLYTDLNGNEAADEVRAVVYEAVAAYANKVAYEYLEVPCTANGYEADAVRHNNRTIDRGILHTLDILRLAYNGEFPNLHAEGAGSPGEPHWWEHVRS
jgi:hypothetical protein